MKKKTKGKKGGMLPGFEKVALYNVTKRPLKKVTQSINTKK